MIQSLARGKKAEWLVFALFTLGLVIISYFHEPWFDEAQAWEIAKGASLSEILFTIPHYEGHPPLWHLILSIPARLGVPFEIGLKAVNLVILLASAYTLIFLSNLPRPVRLLLPFNYFFFYQYGVIVRPYGLMMLVMLILGINFSKRDIRPWLIVSLLGLMCLCSAYGIVIAGGISICIVHEIIREKGIKRALGTVFSDQREMALLALLILAVLLMIEILPRPDTYFAASGKRNPFLICLLCSLLIFPAECFLTSASWFSMDSTLLQTVNIQAPELVLLCLIGIVVWLLIICSASGKTIKFLVIPYVLLAFFSAVVYFSGHHLGVVFMFLLFWAEFISREESRFEFGKKLLERVAGNERDSHLLKRAYKVIMVACLVVPAVWTVTASVHEVQYDYYAGRAAAAFIKEHDLDKLKVFCGWIEEGEDVPLSEENADYVNTIMLGNGVPINAYFDHNIFYNMNHNDPKRGFIYHRRPSLQESQEDRKEWRSHGMPDVIIDKPDLKMVYGDELSYDDYKLVFLENSEFIWKTSRTTGGIPVFLRNDLLEHYGLEALEGPEYAGVNGIEITDEMRERYNNGESAESILDPYLDEMFGED